MSIKGFTKPGHFLAASIPATLVLAFFMEGVARVMLGAPMKPAVLICNILGLDSSLLWVGEIVHYGLGIIGFPIGYVIALMITKQRAGVVTGIVWGVVLWIGAGTVFMTLAGMPLFWGFTMSTVAALVAHVAYGAVLGGLLGRGIPHD